MKGTPWDRLALWESPYEAEIGIRALCSMPFFRLVEHHADMTENRWMVATRLIYTQCALNVDKGERGFPVGRSLCFGDGPAGAVSQWDQASYGFLAEKERRSGSRRTVEGYSRMLRHFFGSSGLTPDQVTAQNVFAWAHSIGLSGRQPGSVTAGARVA